MGNHAITFYMIAIVDFTYPSNLDLLILFKKIIKEKEQTFLLMSVTNMVRNISS